MIFLRRRLIFWLARAYIKKWGKILTLAFLVGIGIIAILFISKDYIIAKIPTPEKTTKIGIAGVVRTSDIPNNLPPIILDKASRGLTKVSDTGIVLPDVAIRWEIKDDGKTYVFYLKDDIYFSDGEKLTSENINYNFKDVEVEKPKDDVIVFRLKDKYSPFLVTLANNKIFKKGNIGVSNYEIIDIEENAGFVDYITLTSLVDNKNIKYDFYDTQAAVKSAYVLGEVDEIIDISDLNYAEKYSFSNFKNSDTKKNINDEKIVTIFLNNQDGLLSDKKLRKALAYVLPEKYSEGQRTNTAYKEAFWANTSPGKYKKDVEYSKLLLEDSPASEGSKLTIELKTLPQYETIARKVANDWKALGINTKIEVVAGVPTYYQAFLGEFPVLSDPDQYTLWHSSHDTNITKYKNLRIDKLLEDGRQVIDLEERQKIYADFQKYLLDDMPAIFLYFPYTFTISRK